MTMCDVDRYIRDEERLHAQLDAMEEAYLRDMEEEEEEDDDDYDD